MNALVYFNIDRVEKLKSRKILFLPIQHGVEVTVCLRYSAPQPGFLFLRKERN